MNTYNVTYLNRKYERVTVTRKAETAWNAAAYIADRYGWGIEYNMVDSETRGDVWGTGFFKIWDPKDGTAYDTRAYTSQKVGA